MDYTKYDTETIRNRKKIYTKKQFTHSVISYFEKLYALKGMPFERPNISEDLKIPQQENPYDCGVFAVMYANYIARNESFDWQKFTKEAVDNFRRKIIYEIDKEEL